MSNDSITLKCSNGFTLIAENGFVTVKTKRDEERIPISSISSVQFKEPGIAYGAITLILNRAPSAGFSLGNLGIALGNERKFFYSSGDRRTAIALRDYITNYQPPKPVQEAPAPQPSSAPSVADQLRSLKALVDDGILTQEEFDAKKKQLLGL